MRHLCTLIAAVFVAPLFRRLVALGQVGAVMVVAVLGRWRPWSSAVEPAEQAAVERARTRSSDALATGRSRPDPGAGPEPMTRYSSRLRPGNRGPRSYAFVDSGIDRWALNRKAPWPYAQRP
jgi:hypothetical protein